MSLPDAGNADTHTRAEVLAEEAIALTGEAAVAAGLRRAREPQQDDFWAGCNDARAAGAAPIYAGEPGYREDMDGDGDGVACEPLP